MHTRRINKPLFALPPNHPARLFLDAFIVCHRECVSLELDGIDQQWFSASERCEYNYARIAYEHLAFDIELDDWLRNSPEMTDSERDSFVAIKHIETLTNECLAAATADGNGPIIDACNKVLRMASLWRNCICERLKIPNPD